MSTYFTTTEAKIINSEYKKPTKLFTQDCGKPYLKFDIYVGFSKMINGEWNNEKGIYFNCTIWNEAKIERFMSKFDNNAKNYITIIKGKFSNFSVDVMEKKNKEDKIYNATVYSNLSISVDDFVITHKPIENENDNTTQDDNVDDEVPY
jgi:hypothetical protein